MPRVNFKELFSRNGSDKGELGYGDIYAELFKDLESPRLLEIGIWKGGSLRAWKEAFPTGQIVGLDINEPPDVRNLRQICDVWIGNQASKEFLKNLVQHYTNFDIIIDDGSHHWLDQQTSFEVLWPAISSEGFYVIEDLGTSYEQKYGWGPGYDGSNTVDFMLKKVPLTIWPPNGRTDIRSIQFYQNLVVLQKKNPKNTPRI